MEGGAFCPHFPYTVVKIKDETTPQARMTTVLLFWHALLLGPARIEKKGTTRPEKSRGNKTEPTRKWVLFVRGAELKLSG